MKEVTMTPLFDGPLDDLFSHISHDLRYENPEIPLDIAHYHAIYDVSNKGIIFRELDTSDSGGSEIVDHVPGLASNLGEIFTRLRGELSHLQVNPGRLSESTCRVREVARLVNSLPLELDLECDAGRLNIYWETRALADTPNVHLAISITASICTLGQTFSLSVMIVRDDPCGSARRERGIK